MVITVSKSTLRRWSKMTDNNEHTKVRISIARKFGFELYVTSLSSIDRRHNELGHLPFELSQTRLKVTQAMLDKIEKYHGIELRNQINSCL